MNRVRVAGGPRLINKAGRVAVDDQDIVLGSERLIGGL